MTALSAILLIASMQAAAATPQLSARLHFAAAAISPGQSTEVAIELTLSEPWHMYHPILLDTGLPTKVTLHGPHNVTFGPVRFPAPTLSSQHDMEYLALSGAFVALAEMTLDASAQPAGEISVRADVSGLACIEACVKVEAQASASLPVQREPGPPASEKLFEQARSAIPPPLADAPYLKGSSFRVSKPQVAIGETAEIIATLKIENQHHIQHRDPGVEGLIPTRLLIETPNGLSLDPARQVWPTPRTLDIPGLGKVNELTGAAEIRAPFSIDDALFPTGPLTLRVLLYYQACREDGQCYAPAFAAGDVTFEVIPGAPSPATPTTAPALASAPPGGPVNTQNLAWILLLAFLGGMVLNVMPCVLPVISLKIFSFIQQAGEERGRIFLLGVMYTLGVLASFLVIAVVMVRTGVAWGGFMQQPLYVILLAAVVLSFALSLFGVFEVRLPGFVENAAGAASHREGPSGAFMNGLLATALATPCTAPLLGPAVGVLVQMPPFVAGAGIMVAGLGLAFPYLLLTAFPNWLRFVPKPGKWMLTVKQIMGFLLIATLIWLLWVLQFHVSSLTLIATLAFLASVGFACWLLGKLSLNASPATTLATWLAVGLVLVGGWMGSFNLLRSGPLADAQPAQATSGDDGPQWAPWRPGKAEELARSGKTVYVDFTAKWCLTCQTNKAAVLHREPVASRLKDDDIALLIADFTSPNDEILKELRRFQRAGVPLNLVYPAGRPEDVIVLPEVLTASIVLDALDKAQGERSVASQ